MEPVCEEAIRVHLLLDRVCPRSAYARMLDQLGAQPRSPPIEENLEGPEWISPFTSPDADFLISWARSLSSCESVGLISSLQISNGQRASRKGEILYLETSNEYGRFKRAYRTAADVGAEIRDVILSTLFCTDGYSRSSPVTVLLRLEG